MLTVAGVAAIVLWIQIISQVSHPSDSPPAGQDFGVFYVGGRLAAEGRWHELYDLVSFSSAYSAETGIDADIGGPVFRYPPPSALALTPLTHIPLSTAFVVWTAVMMVALVAALRCFGRTGLLIPAVLLSAPAVLSFELGQNAPLTVLIFSLGLVLLRGDRPFGAGLALSLLILKPQLAVGPLLWIMTNPWRHRRVLLGVAAGGGAIITASVVAALRGWSTYLASAPSLLAPPNVVGLGYFSGLDFFRLMAPPSGPSPAVAWWVALEGLTVFAFALLFRQTRSHQEGLAIAALATLLLSPHLVAYDWLLLIVPGVFFWQRLKETRPLLLFLAGLLNLAALTTAGVVAAMLGAYQRAVSPAYPLLIICSSYVLIAARVQARDGNAQPNTSRRNLPV